MKADTKRAIYNAVVIAGIATILLMVVIILVQIRNQNNTIKEQTDINQRFFRCLILIPQDVNRTPEQRVELVDKCSVESKLPNGSPLSEAPNADDSH